MVFSLLPARCRIRAELLELKNGRGPDQNLCKFSFQLSLFSLFTFASSAFLSTKLFRSGCFRVNVQNHRSSVYVPPSSDREQAPERASSRRVSSVVPTAEKPKRSVTSKKRASKVDYLEMVRNNKPDYVHMFERLKLMGLQDFAGRIVKVVESFRSPDPATQMSIHEGDYIRINDESGLHWWSGFIIRTKGKDRFANSGFFPMANIESIDEKEVLTVRSWVDEHLMVLKQLENLITAGVLQGELAVLGRFVLIHGLLSKKCGLMYEDRYFIVCNDCIVYARYNAKATHPLEFRRKLLFGDMLEVTLSKNKCKVIHLLFVSPFLSSFAVSFPARLFFPYSLFHICLYLALLPVTTRFSPCFFRLNSRAKETRIFKYNLRMMSRKTPGIRS